MTLPANCLHIPQVRRHNRQRQRPGEGPRRDQILDREVRDLRSREDQIPADKRRADIEDIANVIDDRRKDIGEPVGLLRIPEELVVDGVKVPLDGLLMAEHLNDLLSVEHLLHIALDLAKCLLLLDKELGRAAADLFRDKEHRQNAEHRHDHQVHTVDTA